MHLEGFQELETSKKKNETTNFYLMIACALAAQQSLGGGSTLHCQPKASKKLIASNLRLKVTTIYVQLARCMHSDVLHCGACCAVSDGTEMPRPASSEVHFCDFSFFRSWGPGVSPVSGSQIRPRLSDSARTLRFGPDSAR